MVFLAVLSCALVLIGALARPAAGAPFSELPLPLALPIGGAALATTSVGIYLLGLRLKDRGTAIVAGLLVAASLTLAADGASFPFALLVAALAVFALFSYALGGTVVALSLAGLAAAAHADALPIGVALAAVAFLQRRPRAWIGAVAFLALAGIAGGVWLTLGRADLAIWLPAPRAMAGSGYIAAIGAALLPVSWFLFPYLAEWSQRADRAKWWAPASALALTLAVALVRRDLADALLAALPIVYLMAAAGIARLLPAFAGEFARPLSRYLIAIAALGAVLLARALFEWPALYGHVGATLLGR